MKKTVFLCLALLNLAALYYAATRFFVTFAYVPMQTAAPTALAHLHHQGMEDMRNFLLPAFTWLGGTMLINLAVAGIAAFGKKWRT
jgi:hypothetical protein